MTLAEKKKYGKAEDLEKYFKQLSGKKFKLDCGHHVTFGHNFGNSIHVSNGKNPKIICFLCSY